MRLPKAILLAGLAAAWLAGCGPNRVAGGTSSEAEALLQGTLSYPDGSAAVGAHVRIRPVGYLAHDATITSSMADLIADSAGKVRWITRDTGLFNLEAYAGDSLGTLIRNISPGPESNNLAASLDTNGSLRLKMDPSEAGPAYPMRIFGLERFRTADPLGNLQVTLPAGSYSVLIERAPLTGAPLLLEGILIERGKTTFMDSLRFPALDSALLGHWAFEEGSGDSVRDASGGGHAGVMRGAQWVAGRTGLGLKFTQGQGYVDMGIPQPDVFAFGKIMDYSFSIWAKTDNPVPKRGLGRRLISKQGGADRLSYFLRLFPDGRPGFASNTRPDTTKVPPGGGIPARDMIAPINVSDGTWHHWAGVRKQNRLYLYIDGVQVATASDDSLAADYRFVDYQDQKTPLYPDPGQDNHLMIGCVKSGVDGFDGVIDEARVYGRALSPQEVLMLARPDAPSLR